MKSGTSLWVVVIFGIVTVVMLGVLGLWNQNSPLLKVRGVVKQQYGANVTRTDLVQDEKTKRSAIKMTVAKADHLDEAQLRRIGLEAFVLFLESAPKSKLAEVVVIAGDRQVAVPRAHAQIYGDIQKNMDKVVMHFLKRRIGVAEFEVLGVDGRGAKLRAKMLLTKERVGDRNLADQVQQAVRQTPGVLIGDVEVLFQEQGGSTRRTWRYNARGQLLKEAAPGTRKP